MPRSRRDSVRALTSTWSAPVTTSAGEVGNPLICVASTYTFHAPFLESELLPRFLGLKFDETEGVRPFVVEREERLATTRVCLLIDADHLDPSQSTLRWDQLPVRVPGGAQHSKVVVLVWEKCARLIVSSANLTRQGYRRNREIVGLLDFYDHETSAPRRLILDAIGFLREVAAWVRASGAVKARLQGALEDARARVRGWRNMPADFRPLQRPHVAFVGGLPKERGVTRSPLAQLVDLWGTRRASEIAVMTPFVGDLDGPVDPVVGKLLELPRTRDATGYLVVPGHPSENDAKRMLVGLPRSFLERWASAWGVDPNDVPTYVVPLRRDDEPPANRDLHAKAVLIGGDGATMLLCGSSNFSPHGMGVGAAHVEANLCYLDDRDAKRNGMRLEDRLPVNWEEDLCERPIWPDTAEPIDDEQPGKDRPLPAAFLWAVYSQRTAVLTVIVNPSVNFPREWQLRWPGERSDEAPPLVDHRYQPQPPADGRIVLQLDPSLRGANIAALRLAWRDEEGAMQSATLPVHTEDADDLLPPDEFRSLTAAGILECLLSGREVAEWVEALERRRAVPPPKGPPRELDPLLAVDTSGYVLYRTRRLGAALAALGERLLRTVRTRDATIYRLRQDPLGPRMLAQALVREWREDLTQNGARVDDPTVILFSLAEINLMLAHVARRVTEAHLRPLFREMVKDIEQQCTEITSASGLPPPNLTDYLKAVKNTCEHLLEGMGGGEGRAG